MSILSKVLSNSAMTSEALFIGAQADRRSIRNIQRSHIRRSLGVICDDRQRYIMVQADTPAIAYFLRHQSTRAQQLVAAQNLRVVA